MAQAKAKWFKESTEGVPETVAGAMYSIAGYLENMDEVVGRMLLVLDAPEEFSGIARTAGVQRDLRNMARWFSAHPEIAAEIWAWVGSHR